MKPVAPTKPVPTLAEIAAKAGVSIMTTSLSLRSRPGPSEATRARVLAVAKEMGWRPNPLVSAYQAQVRARRRPGFQANLAWINEHEEPGYWRSQTWARGYLEGARERAAALGFGLEEHHVPRSDPHPRKAARLVRTLEARGVRGVLLPWPTDPAQADMDWGGFAVATIGPGLHPRDHVRRRSGPRFHGARPDIFRNFALAWRELHARGYRRIGLVLDADNDHLAEGAQRACLLMEEHDARRPEGFPEPLVLPVMNASTHPVFRRWLREQRPDVLLTYNAVFMREALPAGRRLDFAKLNLEDGPIGAAGIDSRHEVVAAAAVDLVVGQIYRNESGPPLAPYEIVVAGEWREGNTLRKATAE